MRITIKLGTSTIAHSTGLLNIRQIDNLCRVISDLKNFGHEIVLVSSGAIGLGVGKLSLGRRPNDMPTKQAAASVGQCELMYIYDKIFSQYNHTVGQILLVASDLKDGERHINFQNTVLRLLELGALPIINENDSVTTEEIAIGDNDTLSAVVAVSVKSDLLVLMSDIDGLYTKDPHKYSDAELIPEVREITPEILASAGSKGSELAIGGMSTKLHAAQIATDAGVDMIIMNGSNPARLYDIAEGSSVGTRFIGKGNRK